MLGYLEQENVVFGLTPAPAWSESPTFSADSIGRLPQLRFLEFIVGQGFS